LAASSTSRNSVALSASGLITSLVQIFVVRVYLVTLGPGQYGIYNWFAAFTTTALLITPALSIASQKRVTEAFHASDNESAKQYQRTGSFMTLLLTGLGFCIFLGAGLFYAVPNVRLSRIDLIELFAAAFVVYAVALWNQLLVANLSANDRFQVVAATQTLDRVSGMGISVACVYAFRSPLWIIVGSGIGNTIALVCNAIYLKWQKTMAFKPSFNIEKTQDLGKLVARGYPHRVLTGLGNSWDKVLFPYSGRPISELGYYAVAYGIPDIVQRVLYPVVSVLLPKMTRLTTSNREELGRALHRYGLFVAVLGASIIMPISFSGAPLLKIWLPKTPADAPLTMALIGIYFCAQMYVALFTQPYYASGELQYAAVFSGFNAGSTLLLTIPFARQFGIVGLGLMNAGIGMIQIFPYPGFVSRTCKLNFPVREHMLKVAAIYLIGGAISTAGYKIFQLPFFAQHHWFVLIITPLMMGSIFGVILLLRLCPLSRSLVSKVLSRTVIRTT
jgi:O-antigen/teichoic acid export membrane protein